MKNKSKSIKVTSWVAVIIILAIGSTLTYFIWANANESWVYESVYPNINKKISRAVINIETAGWKTYSDQGYGFSVSHPGKYSSTVSTITQNSAMGVGGTSVGPIVFVKADTSYLKNLATTKFNKYWNYPDKAESPKAYCRKQVMENKQGYDIRIALCLIGTKEDRYAIISGEKFTIFVDGFTSGFDKKLLDTYGTATKSMSQGEFLQILSTFEFL